MSDAPTPPFGEGTDIAFLLLFFITFSEKTKVSERRSINNKCMIKLSKRKKREKRGFTNCCLCCL